MGKIAKPTKQEEIILEVMNAKGFEMYTPGGDEWVRKLILSAFKKIRGKKKFNAQDCEKYIDDRCMKAPSKYAEVWDSEPRYHIAEYTGRMLEACGYQPDSMW